jgi:glycine cleavage system H protein
METVYSAVEWFVLAVIAVLARVGFALAVVLAAIAVLLPVVYAFEGGRRLLARARGIQELHGLEWRRSPFYSAAHMWLRDRGTVVRLGIDALAARLLARVDQVALPVVGTQVSKGAPLATFTAGGHLVSVPAPIDGVVTTVNDRLSAEPEAATEHPYGGGWLVEMRPADNVFRMLPRAAAARQWFNGEAERLTFALDHASELAAADGGVPVVPHRMLLTEEQFERLAGEFLKATVSSTATPAPPPA